LRRGQLFDGVFQHLRFHNLFRLVDRIVFVRAGNQIGKGQEVALGCAIVVDDEIMRDAKQPALKRGPSEVVGIYVVQCLEEHVLGQVFGLFNLADAEVNVAIYRLKAFLVDLSKSFLLPALSPGD